MNLARCRRWLAVPRSSHPGQPPGGRHHHPKQGSNIVQKTLSLTDGDLICDATATSPNMEVHDAAALSDGRVVVVVQDDSLDGDTPACDGLGCGGLLCGGCDEGQTCTSSFQCQ